PPRVISWVVTVEKLSVFFKVDAVKFPSVVRYTPNCKDKEELVTLHTLPSSASALFSLVHAGSFSNAPATDGNINAVGPSSPSLSAGYTIPSTMIFTAL